jgi:hypothetical protein
VQGWGDMPGPDDQRTREGLAARAVALVELGSSDAEVVADLDTYLARFGMRTAEAVREVAAAIDRLPSTEEDLEAMRRARAVLEEYATHLERQG